MTTPDQQLDNPVWYSLTTHHHNHAVGSALAAAYPADMSPFFGLPDNPAPEHWAAAADLLAVRHPALLHQHANLPAGWTADVTLDVVQMFAPDPIGRVDPRAVPLGADDVPAMLGLAAAAKPGPFGPKTPLFGGYHGIWIDGILAAMAGERFRVDGWTEISAVATSPDHRGQGLASALMRTIAARIEDRGEKSFLHVVDTNPARGLYEHLGFHERSHTPVRSVTFTPEGSHS